jgi:hypothetical protein
MNFDIGVVLMRGGEVQIEMKNGNLAMFSGRLWITSLNLHSPHH